MKHYPSIFEKFKNYIMATVDYLQCGVCVPILKSSPTNTLALLYYIEKVSQPEDSK